ncbi:hypothetical protein HK097_001014, partial [Rhizophlyctis rosea]
MLIFPLKGDAGYLHLQLSHGSDLAYETIISYTVELQPLKTEKFPIEEWTLSSIDLNKALKDNPKGAEINNFFLMNSHPNASVEFYIAMWLGNLEDWKPGAPPPVYVERPFVGPRGETTFAEINVSSYEFLTMNQSLNVLRDGDMGLIPEWQCNGKVWRGYGDVADVYIGAFRDTTEGPLPMNVTHNVVFDYTASTLYYTPMFGNKVARDAWDVPNPVLGC